MLPGVNVVGSDVVVSPGSSPSSSSSSDWPSERPARRSSCLPESKRCARR